MFFIHQVVPGPEGHQVSVVCWCRDGHRACAAHVSVTQLVGENLQLIRRETIVVPEHVVVGRPACPLGADQRVRDTSRTRRGRCGWDSASTHWAHKLFTKNAGEDVNDKQILALSRVVMKRHRNYAFHHPMCKT